MTNLWSFSKVWISSFKFFTFSLLLPKYTHWKSKNVHHLFLSIFHICGTIISQHWYILIMLLRTSHPCRLWFYFLSAAGPGEEFISLQTCSQLTSSFKNRRVKASFHYGRQRKTVKDLTKTFRKQRVCKLHHHSARRRLGLTAHDRKWSRVSPEREAKSLVFTPRSVWDVGYQNLETTWAALKLQMSLSKVWRINPLTPSSIVGQRSVYSGMKWFRMQKKLQINKITEVFFV